MKTKMEMKMKMGTKMRTDGSSLQSRAAATLGY